MGCGNSASPKLDGAPQASKSIPGPRRKISFGKHSFDATVLPPAFLRHYLHWERLNCPGGSQLATECASCNQSKWPRPDCRDCRGLAKVLAWRAEEPKTKNPIFVKSFKNPMEGRQEWELTSQHLQPPHPNVSCMLRFEEHKALGFAGFRFHEGKDLFEHIKSTFNSAGVKLGARRWSECEIQNIMRMICEPIQWMHDKGVAHRDIKPENIMAISSALCGDSEFEHIIGQVPKAEEGSLSHQLYIVDLGSCIYCKDGRKGSEDMSDLSLERPQRTRPDLHSPRSGGQSGHGQNFVPTSEGFTSPEQILDSDRSHPEWHPSDPFASDVYAIGGVMAMLILGSAQEYLSSEWPDEAWSHLQERLERTQHSTGLSPQAVQLLDQLIMPEASRPSVAQVLQHPWFTDGDLQRTLEEQARSESWQGTLDRLVLRGREPLYYEAGDYLVLETGSLSEYIVRKKSFERLYKAETRGQDIQTMSPSEQADFPTWERAESEGMRLFWRHPSETHRLVQMTTKTIQELHDAFQGQSAVYSSNPRNPEGDENCRVTGRIPSNVDVAKFCFERTKAGAWSPVTMLKRAVFAKQLQSSGSMLATRVLHPQVSSEVPAFVYLAPAASRKYAPFAVPGDFLKIMTRGEGDAHLPHDDFQVATLGQLSVEPNFVTVDAKHTGADKGQQASKEVALPSLSYNASTPGYDIF